MTPWLDKHIGDVATALHTRLFHPDSFARRWQMIFHESQPGTRGGIAVIPCDDILPNDWQPVQGVFAECQPSAMTRDQIAYFLRRASQRLPVLDPNEPYNAE